MSTRDMVRQVIGAQAIVDEAGKHVKQMRQALLLEMGAGDRVTIKDDAGEQLGMVYVTDPKPRVQVTDSEALRTWVEANRPEEIVWTASVRASFVDALIADGGIDANTGECVPGIEAKVGTPTLAVKPAERARELAADMLPGLPVLDGQVA